MYRLEVRSEAELESFEAALWYETERGGLGTEFLSELRATFRRIEERPLQFPSVFEEIRRALLHRFPYAVFFTLDSQLVTVTAVMHLHRDPSTWQERR